MLGCDSGWWDGTEVALEGSPMVVVNLNGNGVFGAVWVIGMGRIGYLLGKLKLGLLLTACFIPANPLWRLAFWS